ncbi:MAG: hypothetical protein ACR2HH_02810 [Chthoniobacterales bacterium]
MKTLSAFLIIFLGTQAGQALACAVCYGAAGSKVNDHMAIAIWVMLGAIMSVLGGVGAFSFHLWRHAHMPLEPHQELTEEDFAEYD